MRFLDDIVNEFDIALKTLSNKKSGTGRTYPPEPSEKNTEELTPEEKKLSIQMMRVNLAGEVAAQALYRGQSLVCKDAKVKKHLIEAGEEETDHLVWCKKRLDELEGSGSLLNPIWYAGSFAIGAIFGRFGEKVSLGFVEETEKQVVNVRYIKFFFTHSIRMLIPCTPESSPISLLQLNFISATSSQLRKCLR